jgi:hypothetical protein
MGVLYAGSVNSHVFSELCYNECVWRMGALYADSVKRPFDEKAFQ